ncbi:MAG: M28 family peptidase [Nannocystaceae bacterium]
MTSDTMTSRGLALAALVSLTGCADEAPTFACPQPLEDAITQAALVAHMEALADLAQADAGTRAATTPGYAASLGYVEGALRDAGYVVTRDAFEYTDYELLSVPVVEVVAPAPRALVPGVDFLSARFSGSGDVTAPVAAVDLALGPDNASTSACEPADFDGFPAGAIALIQRGSCAFATKEALAAEAGASAIVMFNQGNTEARVDLFTPRLDPVATLPVVGVSYGLGVELADALSEGLELRVEVEGRSVTSRSENLLADAPGAADDGVIVVGAHLDSVPAGPGINDNGSGTAAVLELAVQAGQCTLQQPVRFAFWGAEELGLIGSASYVRGLSDEGLAALALYLNLDMIASPNFGRFLYDGDGSTYGDAGPPGSAAIEAALASYYAERGLPTLEVPFDGRSDYGPFIALGVPAGGIFTGAETVKTAEIAAIFGGAADAPYDACYHRECDDRGNYDARELHVNARAVAHVVEAYALGRAPLPGDDAASPTTRAANAGRWTAAVAAHAGCADDER